MTILYSIQFADKKKNKRKIKRLQKARQTDNEKLLYQYL